VLRKKQLKNKKRFWHNFALFGFKSSASQVCNLTLDRQGGAAFGAPHIVFLS